MGMSLNQVVGWSPLRKGDRQLMTGITGTRPRSRAAWTCTQTKVNAWDANIYRNTGGLVEASCMDTDMFLPQ